MSDDPSSLLPALSLLEEYLNRLPDKPFLAMGSFGCGRGHALKVALERRKFRPVWMYENEEVPEFDLEDRRLFPIYDLPKPEIPKTSPSILLVPYDFRRSEEFGVFEFGQFPPPSIHDRERFLRDRGYPVGLADGNPNYPALLGAMVAWDVAGIVLHYGALEDPSWDEFCNGGEPPVPIGLLPYYSAYAFPPGEWWWNRNLGERKIVPSAAARILLDQIRLEWPAGKKIAFPDILKEPKGRKPPAPLGTSTAIPTGPKKYAVDW